MRKSLITALLPLILLLLLVGILWAAAVSTISVNCSVSGLGSSVVGMNVTFSGDVPDGVVRGYRKLSDANTAEELDLGDISTVGGILLVADACDVVVDCNFVSTFKESVYISEGECAYFKPCGVVKVRNPAGTTYTPTYEYIAFGTR